MVMPVIGIFILYKYRTTTKNETCDNIKVITNQKYKLKPLQKFNSKMILRHKTQQNN